VKRLKNGYVEEAYTHKKEEELTRKGEEMKDKVESGMNE
jgi:hypothetical protein